MTAINALARRDRVHLMTDGAVFMPSGRVIATMSKAYLFPQASAVLALRGPMHFGPALFGAMNGRSLESFDDLLSELPNAVREVLRHGLGLIDAGSIAAAAALTDLQRADVVAVGWSHARARGEIHRLDASKPNFALEDQGLGFLMPGDSPELMARLQGHGWDLSDESQDESRLMELMHHQRAVDDHLPNGARFSTVGGFAQHTIITADGINTRIVERWPTDVAAENRRSAHGR